MQRLVLLFLFLPVFTMSQAQQVIPLPHTQPEPTLWDGPERAYDSSRWNTPVVSNVSKPTLIYYPAINPAPQAPCVVIAPGGGVFALSMQSEGSQIAEWLAERGIASFIVKYRLVPTNGDATEELSQLRNDNDKRVQKIQAVLPYAIEDALSAITHVRQNTAVYGINPNKVGFMGFSAGGLVGFGMIEQWQESNRPDFFCLVYPGTDILAPAPRKDIPPTLFVCAANDPLGIASALTARYKQWLDAGINTGLHMYSKGGHGFGMRTQHLPSDRWIERFHEWADAEGFLSPSPPGNSP